MDALTEDKAALVLLATREGWPATRIARALGIGLRTVRRYRSQSRATVRQYQADSAALRKRLDLEDARA